VAAPLIANAYASRLTVLDFGYRPNEWMHHPRALNSATKDSPFPSGFSYYPSLIESIGLTDTGI
jgi:hypothetical protein